MHKVDVKLCTIWDDVTINQISKCNKCKWNWNARYWNSMLCHHGSKALNSELTLYLEQCKIEIDAYVLCEY